MYYNVLAEDGDDQGRPVRLRALCDASLPQRGRTPLGMMPWIFVDGDM